MNYIEAVYYKRYNEIWVDWQELPSDENLTKVLLDRYGYENGTITIPEDAINGELLDVVQSLVNEAIEAIFGEDHAMDIVFMKGNNI